MRVSLSHFFKAAAPHIVLLPDTLFFVRAIPVAADATPAELVAQVELAVEAIAPFTLAQIYYGFYHPPGSSHALLYAAYRKRFTVEQTALWADANLVLPSFVALLGGEIKPATTLLAGSTEGLTALHWNGNAVPEKVLTRVLAPDASPEERARVRDELLQAVGDSLKIIDLSEAPAPVAADNGELVFRAGDFASRLPAALTDQLDVRDKEELARRRRHQARDLILWRVFLSCAAVIAFCFLSEITLLGGRLWQRSRLALITAQSPAVEKIEAAKNLADKIDERLNKRLRPFEMITIVSSCKPASVQFIRVTVVDYSTLEIEAQTNAPNDVPGYQTALTALPACSSVDLRDQRTREGASTFTLVITFKLEELKPADRIGPSATTS